MKNMTPQKMKKALEEAWKSGYEQREFCGVEQYEYSPRFNPHSPEYDPDANPSEFDKSVTQWVFGENKFARRCDITNKGMNEGFCIGDGSFYVANDEDMLKHLLEETEYKTIEESYNDEYHYWTEWTEEDCEDTFYDAEGNEYEFDEDGNPFKV